MESKLEKYCRPCAAGLCAAALLLSTAAAAGDAAATEPGSGPVLDLPPDDPADASPPAGESGDVIIGGYGEMHFNRVMPEAGDSASEIDFHRMVLYLGRDFGHGLRFYSETEVEHAIVGDGKPGEVALEQAYVDYQLADSSCSIGELGIRAGIVLVPMGIINQWHEPPVFHGVERPAVDKVIIPSTWREGGLGIFGRPAEQLSYELYVVGGLNPLGFKAKDGIRGGRQKVGEARADGLAVTGRVEGHLGTATTLGLAGYFGQAGPNTDETDADVPVFGTALDARTRYRGIEARAVFAIFTIGDSDELRALVDGDGNPLTDVADRVLGTYGEVAYNVLEGSATAQALLPFVRVEYYDTDPDDKSRSVVDAVVGLSYRPVSQVAFKSDLVFHRPRGTGVDANIFNLGVGFLY